MYSYIAVYGGIAAEGVVSGQSGYVVGYEVACGGSDVVGYPAEVAVVYASSEVCHAA